MGLFFSCCKSQKSSNSSKQEGKINNQEKNESLQHYNSTFSESNPELNQDKEKKILSGMLSQINSYRSKHGCQPLELNLEISTIAQKAADNLSKAGIESPSNSIYKNEKLGESIYIGNFTTYENLGSNVINGWYSEGIKKGYNYNSNNYNEDFKNFTQLLWKKTKEVGFGIARNDDNSNPRFKHSSKEGTVKTY